MILTNIQNICCLKILCNVFAQFLIDCHLLSKRFRGIQIVIITNFVVPTSVGVTRVDCIISTLFYLKICDSTLLITISISATVQKAVLSYIVIFKSEYNHAIKDIIQMHCSLSENNTLNKYREYSIKSTDYTAKSVKMET